MFCNSRMVARFVLAVILAGFLVPALSIAEPGLRLYVSRSGNDGNPGTKEKPFASPERARDAIRRIKQKGGLPVGGVSVELRGGVYERGKTFELSAADSGTERAPIVYRAHGNEEVRLVGGRVITGWKPVTNNNILERMDRAAHGKVLQANLRALGVAEFGKAAEPGFKPALVWITLPGKRRGLELFFGGKRMEVARWPNAGEGAGFRPNGTAGDGYTHTTEIPDDVPRTKRWGKWRTKVGKFVYKNDRLKRWINEKDLWVHGFWGPDWADDHHKVESIDPEKRTITLAKPYHYYGYSVDRPFYVFNALIELDRPGEWYLDRESGILYFWPPVPIADGRPTVSVLSELVWMKGASHVTLRGMTMEATRGAAVTIIDGTQNRVVGCVVRHIGGDWALKAIGGKGNGFIGCDVYNLAGGAVWISGGDRKTLTPAGNFVENCHIHDFQQWRYTFRPGVFLNGVGQIARHNLIHDAPHNAIWFYENEHIIELNEVHSVCWGTGDVGVIYVGADLAGRGTVVRHNFVHHARGLGGGLARGVYLDDMQCGITVYGNVFQDVKLGVFISGGRDNTLENNVFLDCGNAFLLGATGLRRMKGAARRKLQGLAKIIPYKQPPWSTRYPELANMLDDEPNAPKGNKFLRNVCNGCGFSISGNARPYVKTIKDNLVSKEPIDIKAQLEGAYKLGFKRIPFEKIGLYRDERRASWPVRHRVRMDIADKKPYGKGWQGNRAFSQGDEK